MNRLRFLSLVIVAISFNEHLVAYMAFAQAYQGIDLYALKGPGALNLGVIGRHAVANGGQVISNVYYEGLDRYEALLWTNPDGMLVNLPFPNAGRGDDTLVYATDGRQQVGIVSQPTTYEHAALWTGTPQSLIDLHPIQFGDSGVSTALGVGAGQQVGYGVFSPGELHAILWNGTADSAVKLHPTLLDGCDQSVAYGTDGTHQVGLARGNATPGVGDAHAMLWSGTAESAIDLHPTNFDGFDFSVAYGVHGFQQVGAGYGHNDSANARALLWSGTADSAIDLNPTSLGGGTSSEAFATNGIFQVGVVTNTGSWTGRTTRAVVWNGSAVSFIDLSQFIPDISGSSQAYSIDEHNRIFGVAFIRGERHAVMWVPVPEPVTILLSATCLLPLGGRR